MSVRYLFFKLLVLFVVFGCAKDENSEESSLDIQLTHLVDGVPLVLGDELYQNTAGNHYKVVGLRYYISEIALWQNDEVIYQSEEIFYVNANDGATFELNLKNVKPGSYSAMTYLVGISDERNNHGELPNEEIHNQMIWPEPMGGGYHFLKMEGYYYNEESNQFGFAIHQGTSAALVKGNITQQFDLNEGVNNFSLNHNVNSWFDSPYVYDLSIDEAYTMGDSLSMAIIANNGVDVLELDN